MAFLRPHFEYDVFVSYSHGAKPGKDKAPLRDWTRNLIDDLEADMYLDPEFNELHVWCDREVDPTEYLTPGLRQTVQSAGILIIVMSKKYLTSTWFKDELEWFKEQVKDRSRDQGRVFVIRAEQTDEKHWPDFLRDARGHGLPGFWFYDRETGKPYWYMGAKYNHELYVRELIRLGTALARRLRELSDNRTPSTPPSAPPPVGAHRRIYLHARPEQKPVNDSVRLRLAEDGIVPLGRISDPGPDLADWVRESQARMETAKDCDALALVRANEDDRFVPDLLEVGVYERERVESSRGAPLPCAVLDGSGRQPLPIMARYGIARFDLAKEDWPRQFHGWLEQARQAPIRQ